MIQTDRSVVSRNSRQQRLCIVSSLPPGELETFIRAHVDLLPFESTYVYGGGETFWWNGKRITDIYAEKQRSKTRALAILPHVVEFRIRRKFFPSVTSSAALAQFFRDHSFDAVLAEYGPVAADLTEPCKASSTPLVAHFHGYDASRIDILERYRDGYRNMFQYASTVIAVSEPMRLQLIQSGCPPEKIIVTACGPNNAFFDLRPDYESDSVVMVGRLVDKKAPHLSILAFSRAVAENPALRLQIIGEGPLLGACRDLVRSLGIDRSVEFHGRLTTIEIQRQLGNAFVFTQHSVTADNGDMEGTPVAILEAGAAGLPVVATMHGGIPEAVVNGKTGVLVKERDVNGAASALARLSSDRSFARLLGQAARKHISASFSIEKHIDDVACAIADAIQPKHTLGSN